jgi:assimilatory nitrate reductase catalytic subunit
MTPNMGDQSGAGAAMGAGVGTGVGVGMGTDAGTARGGWSSVCDFSELWPNIGVGALVNGRQIAIFLVGEALYALDNYDPASGANVLSRGIVGDVKGECVVASPLYKHHYGLVSGRCLEDSAKSVNVYPVRVLDGRVWVNTEPQQQPPAARQLTPPIVRTTCPYCGVGCGVLARRLNGTVEIAGDTEHPANFGRLCSKGFALRDTVGLEGRLLYPSIHGRRVAWDEALTSVARGFSDVIQRHGPDAVAFYVSGQLLTEDYYIANKLMKGFIGSANIDTNSRLCMASAVAGHRRAFGGDLVPGCYEDLTLADLIVLTGSNTAWCHPVLFRRIVQEKERRPELKLVVIDPRRTATAEIADLHLPIRSGSDVPLFNGLLTSLRRRGATDTEFVFAHTSGAIAALDAAEASAPDVHAVSRACGIEPTRIEEFYRLFAATERVVTAFSQGVNQSSAGTDKVNSIINCHLLTGRIGRPGMGPFSLTGQPNAMGGREVGGMANMLAAHMELEDPLHRARVQEFWRSPRMASRPGLKAVELFEAVHEGRIKAIWIMATNPVVSLPDSDRVRAALQKCELVVVSDCVARTDTTALAHVLLPAAAWGEKDGTVTNSERRISRQRAFGPLPGEAQPDWSIMAQVAQRMGFVEEFNYGSPAEIFDEHARLSAVDNGGTRVFDIGGLAGLTSEEYEKFEPIQWPVPRREHKGTQRLFEDGRFQHPDGRARFVPTAPIGPAAAAGEEFPFILNTGRIRDQWHTMTRTSQSPQLNEHLPEPFADLHAQDALLLAVRDGELARVTTARGSMVARVRTSGEVARGCVFAPIHWSAENASQARAGALVSAFVDPISGEPEFKHTPARVEPFPVEWYGLVLSRESLAVADVTWWTTIRGRGWHRYELAGREVRDWALWMRHRLGANAADGDYLEYQDAAAGIYRAAHLVDDRLRACLYVSRRPELPERSWLAGLFERGRLEAPDRIGLLAGRPAGTREDAGPLVCSCWAVGRNTLRRAIAQHGLSDPKQVGARFRAGTGCGSCVPEIKVLIAEHARKTSPSPPQPAVRYADTA